MRCPSCGTENTPDSRFCGGCGARLSPEAPRVAPTLKVSDDAPYPTPAPPPARSFGMHDSLVPTSPRNPSIPPAASIPPTSQRPQSSMPYPRAQSPALSNPPAMSDPALSMPVVHRPWGLISVVLVIDLALAGTGGLLLAKGLSARSSSPPPSPTSGPAPAAAPAPAPATAPAPAPGAAPAPAAAPTPAAGSAAAAPPPPAPTKPDPKAAAKRHVTHTAARVGASKLDPQDPYDDLENEIDLAASRSQAELARCHTAAGDVHGAIRIAFEVLPDGHVTHAAAVENTTGSTQLADCLTAAVGRWAFAVHPAQPTDFVRPFSY